MIDTYLLLSEIVTISTSLTDIITMSASQPCLF